MTDHLNSDAIGLQARAFVRKKYRFDIEDYPLCNQNNPVYRNIRNPTFFVKRKDPVGNQAFVYFATENPAEGDPQTVARAIAYGTKEGKCTLGKTPQDKLDETTGDAEPAGIDENCGFEVHVLKNCIEDRGKAGKNPLKKPGFDPTKGPYQRRDQEIAAEAFANCEVIIQAEITNYQPPADGEDATLPPLREISNIIFSARVKRDKPGSSKFDLVFVDKKGERDQMIITKMDYWKELFPDPWKEPTPEFTSQRRDYGRLLREIMPNMFLCACPSKNKWCSTIPSRGDSETSTLIATIIANATPRQTTISSRFMKK